MGNLLTVESTFLRSGKGIKLEDLEKYFKSLEVNVVTVGVHKDAGQDNVNKMVWNEFGTNHKLKYNSVAIPNVGLKPMNENNADMGDHVKKGADISIPARPVVRMYLYPKMVETISWNYRNDIDIEKNSKLKNPEQSAEKVQRHIGEVGATLQRQKISTRNFAPVDTKGKDINNNSRLTQKIKGYNQPYIDSGELLSKIDYKVQRKS